MAGVHEDSSELYQVEFVGTGRLVDKTHNR